MGGSNAAHQGHKTPISLNTVHFSHSQFAPKRPKMATNKNALAPFFLLLFMTVVPTEAFHIQRSVHSRRESTVALCGSPSETIDIYKSRPPIDDGFGPLDFGITDSLAVPDDARPTLVEASSNPRDVLAILLLGCGCAVGYHNILGIYGPSYALSQGFAVALGFLNAFAVTIQLRNSYLISARPRMGIVDDAALTAYAGLYSAAASWLALRTSTLCPLWLASWDKVLPLAAAGIFAYSLVAPAITLYEHFTSGAAGGDTGLSEKMVRASRMLTPLPQDQAVPSLLSNTELFRVKGLVFIGILGCVFVPACLAFAFQGEEWWGRVCELHPKQRLLESTDALFALFATEASMICTRAASAGVAPYRKAVPAFAAVCLGLALVPCACSLWWLGGNSDISFFSFYTE